MNSGPGGPGKGRPSWRWGLLPPLCLALLGLVAALAPISLAAETHHRSRPFDTGNPRSNQSDDNFNGICAASGGGSAACHNAELVGLLDAHLVEGLAVPEWPARFWRLPADQQLFILADEERVDRHLPPLVGITASANLDALPGAQHDRDPVAAQRGHPAVLDWASNWASDYGTMAAEFDWMYDDGVSKVKNQGNLDCPRASAPGCWGHRENTLIQFPGAGRDSALVFGGACVVDHEYRPNLSCAELFELLARPPSHYLFTWRQALQMGA